MSEQAGNPAQISAGVQALIDKLRSEGVAAGEQQAADILSRAKADAEALVADAEVRAQEIVEVARGEADNLRSSGEEALRIAFRDSLLRVKAELSEQVNERVKRLILTTMQREDFLERLILEVAGKARPSAFGEHTEVLLPKNLVGLDELRRNPLELKEGSLSHFILKVAGEVLEEGVQIGETDAIEAGVRLSLKDRDVEIDLTDDAVARLLLQHLNPRFRAILEGTVR